MLQHLNPPPPAREAIGADHRKALVLRHHKGHQLSGQETGWEDFTTEPRRQHPVKKDDQVDGLQMVAGDMSIVGRP